MSHTIVSSSHRPLAIAVSSLFGLSVLAAAPLHATTVTNCFDAGTGSLRAAVAATTDGGVVDMSALTKASAGCLDSTITLTTGDIVINQNSLTIKGPGAKHLNITARDDSLDDPHQYPNRIFTHNGNQTLTVGQVTVSNGLVIGGVSPARGGCIYSKGSVQLQGATVTGCVAHTDNLKASGGGVYSHGPLTLSDSIVSSNYADAGQTGYAIGGGLYTSSLVIMGRTTVIGNVANHGDRAAGSSGGFFSLQGSSYLYDSTIANNVAGARCGGGSMGSSFGASQGLYESTVSGNVSLHGSCGGLSMTGIRNYVTFNTIVDNQAADTSDGFSGGLTIVGRADGYTYAYMNLIARNRANGVRNDLTITSSAPATLNNNLIWTRPSGSNFFESGQITGCPILGPLRDNGGPTPTIALLSGSPGIDVFTHSPPLRGADAGDQRGLPFERLSNLRLDVGAYEVQRDDVVFNTGFEGGGCPQ